MMRATVRASSGATVPVHPLAALVILLLLAPVLIGLMIVTTAVCLVGALGHVTFASVIGLFRR